MKRIILLTIFLLLISTVSAKQGHMKLLAVKDTPDGHEGATADLYLEIIPGKGRVFLETYPLLKINTQVSTRFAKEIACEYLNVNCDNHDFIYTITSDTAIIGGPSAGAAISALTIAMLEDVEINENISITGTINSGGIVGSVGALKEKINAAEQSSLNIVLIPEGERFIKENIINKTENLTIYNKTDLYEYGKEHNLRIIGVSTLDDIMHIITGKIRLQEITELTVDEKYKKTMKKLASNLCNRSDKLKEMVDYTKDKEFNSTLSSAINLSEKGKNAFENEKYYSSASYCFGANVKFSQLILLSRNLTEEETLEKTKIIENNIKDFNKVLDKKKIKTITDLEAFMVVKERLTEASNELELAKENINKSYENLGYASERVYSAHSWFEFFDNRGKRINFNKESLKKACENKIKEAEEHIQYADYFIPTDYEKTKKEIDLALKDMDNEDYELCLFKASKSKAEADVLLSMMYVESKDVDSVINQKIGIAKKSVAEQVKKGVFPILGYSYYEYANTLNSTDKYSTSLYSEYARELSNLDLYLKDKKKVYFYRINKEAMISFILGILIGIFASLIYIPLIRKKFKNPSRTLKRALLGKKR